MCVLPLLLLLFLLLLLIALVRIIRMSETVQYLVNKNYSIFVSINIKHSTY